MAENIPFVGSADFDATIGAGTPTLVDFTASWCGPCKELAPILDEVAVELDGRLHMVKVDIDESPGLAERFGVRGVPTMIIFEQGELLARSSGSRPKADVLAFIEQLID